MAKRWDQANEPQVCTETYGFSAEVVCTGNLRASIPYIPIHIDYMCAAEAPANLMCGLQPNALVVLQSSRCFILQIQRIAAIPLAYPGNTEHAAG